MFESNQVYSDVEFHLNGKNIYYFKFLIIGKCNYQFAVTIIFYEKEGNKIVSEQLIRTTYKIIGLETTEDKHIFHIKEIK